MKVFLSWSGEQSRLVANALRDWLPGVLQEVEPWLDSTDMAAGSRWESSIKDAIDNSDAAIVCLTSTNLKTPWVNYEAGAFLASDAPVIPLLLDMRPVDVSGPLATLQCVTMDHDGLFRLLKSLNGRIERPLANASLERAFEMWWPSLEASLDSARAQVVATAGESIPANDRSSDDKQNEMVALLRELNRSFSMLSDRVLTSTTTPPPVSEQPVVKAKGGRPRLFIGSSSEGLPIAQAIQQGLEYSVEATIWSQGVFAPGATAIESLVDVARQFDFAVVIMTPDDVTIARGVEQAAPRDNLTFEAGLFTGLLGRGRTFVVRPRSGGLRFPSDLSGVNMLTFDDERQDGNLEAALGPACAQIKRAMGIA